MVKLMNLILNTPNSTDFINTLATKQYVDSEVNKAKKEIGESIFSLVPLQNAGYHLYDGALIDGSGIYADFVSKIEQLYTAHPEWGCWEKEATFSQPNLNNNNGTFGSDSFAVSASSEFDSNYPAWKAFDGTLVDTTDAWITTKNVTWGTLTFYNPTPIKVTKLTVTNRYASEGIAYVGAISSGTVYGSNDNSTWTELKTFTNSINTSASNWDIDLSDNTNFYKYYKLDVVTPSSNYYVCVGKLTITAYLNPENAWQDNVTRYGVCGKFVVDTTNHTVRLPKVTGIVEGTLDTSALGDLIEAGVPNITGTVAIGDGYGLASGATGAFADHVQQSSVWGVSNAVNANSWKFNANKSNPIYGNSDTVQPQTIKGYYYIVLANVTKTEIQVDIDNVVTDLNGKAGTDFANINNTAKIAIAHNAMPSDVYDDLTLGARGTTYTAPADGYVYLNVNANAGDWSFMQNNTNKLGVSQVTSYGGDLSSFIPVKKGDLFTIVFAHIGAVNFFRFIYAVGSESEKA